MRKFAKLFDVGERQLIVYVEFDEESDNDRWVLHQITSMEGVMMDVEFGGSKGAMNAILDQYDQEAATNFFTLPIVAKTIATMEAA